MENPLFLTVTKTTGNVTVHTDVTLWYILKGNCNDAFAFDRDEFHRVEWFAPQEIPYEKSDPHMNRFMAKMQTRTKMKI